MNYLIISIGLLLIFSSSGCAPLPRNPVPLADQESAEIPGMSEIRAISGLDNQKFEEDILYSDHQYRSYRSLTDTEKLVQNLLVLSGGADNGAFGAGFLNGWSRAGTRPEFKIVTGVSTGALIAPFAFLGSDHDEELKDAFTTINARDIYTRRGFISALWDEAFVDTEPLVKLIERYCNESLLSKVAREHDKGRRLWIATVNLDADRLVIWNMGAIAKSSHPDALKLFRQVILASSSIPGVFPPVLIDVKVKGKPFDEMHVDGGVKAQLFVTAETLNLKRLKTHYIEKIPARPEWRIFIIRNSQVGPEPQQVPRKVSNITRKAFSSLLKSNGRSDLERIYRLAKENELDFNWISLPTAYKPETQTPFDKAEMNRMFNLGYELGLKGNSWRKQPPGLGQN